MRFVVRELASEIQKGSHAFGAVVLTGPRRSGKTFLLRHLYPEASYHLLEEPDLLDRIQSDPRGWLEEIRTPAILDEIQNAPQLLPYIRAIIDRNPRKRGQWFLTGSQEFSLMKGVTESMAGRAALFQLLPFSYRELGKWDLLRGGFPEVWARPGARRAWFRSYLQTYLERDVRSVLAVHDLPTYRRFLGLLATRHGQILNKVDLAAPLGLSTPAITKWLNVLEVTHQILIVPPYYENLSKRIIKSPKIYFVDPGLVCHLLGFESLENLERSPYVGPVFEGFVAAEIAKGQLARGRRAELYHFRDTEGLEVDFVVPGTNATLNLIEAKYTRTVLPRMGTPVAKLLKGAGERAARGFVVHREGSGPPEGALVPGVRGITVERFLEAGLWGRVTAT
jgi:hypothetical protein